MSTNFRPIITSRQLLVLLIGATLPTESLLQPGPLIVAFGKDALWVILGGGLLATLPLLATLLILRRQQRRTLAETLGRHGIVGRLVPILFATGTMLGLINIWASFAQLLRADLLPSTPAWVTTGSGAAAVLYGAIGGPEVVGRVAQVLVPFFVAETGMMFVVAAPWFEPVHLLPLLPEHGLSLTSGIYQVFTFLAEISFATYFGSLVRDSHRISRVLWTALVINTLLLLLMTALPLLMFGVDHAKLLAVPPLSAVRAIHYGFLVERLDAFVAGPWATFIAIKLIIWTVFASSLLADVFGRRAFFWSVWLITAGASTFSLGLGSLTAVQTNLPEAWYDTGAPLILTALVVAALAVGRRGRGPTRA